MMRIIRPTGIDQFAFLASTWADDEMKKLRCDIHALGEAEHQPVWVAEKDAEELREEIDRDPMKIVDNCLDEIEHSKIFIFIVDGKFGSLVRHKGKAVASSFIELELFQAVMHEKPVHVIIIGEVQEDSEIGKLLSILSFALGEGLTKKIATYTEAFATVKAILKSYKNMRFLFNTHQMRRELTGHLALQRHHDFANKRLFEEIEFLDGGQIANEANSPDLDLVKEIIESANLEVHSNRKMSRIWMAMRCLMNTHYRSTSDQRILELWEDALSSWTRFAGWRGLHAHLFLGHAAALGSLHIIRQQYKHRSIESKTEIEHEDLLGGAFASVYFSLSKIASHQFASSFLARSESYVYYELERVEEHQQSGLLTILGSVHLQMGKRHSAISDFHAALNLAERFQLSDQRIGEITSELGWAELQMGHFNSGRSHIEEGVSHMEQGDGPAGFLVRGKRKLAAARAINLDFSGAFRQAIEAKELIHEHGLYDQMDFTIKTADKIQRLIDSLKKSNKNI